jgi:hypothetical protein
MRSSAPPPCGALAFGVSEIKRPATQSVEYTTRTKTSPLKKPLPQVASRSANGLLAAISLADLDPVWGHGMLSSDLSVQMIYSAL